MLLSPRLRALSILPGALLQPPSDTSELTFTVRFFDVDLNVHLTNSRYPQLMDVGRLDLLLRSRTMGRFVRDGVKPLVVETTLKFRKELRYGQTFTLRTRLISIARRAATIEQRFMVGEVEHAHATVKVLLAKGGRIIDPSPYLPPPPDAPEAPGSTS
jgi:acyl-CoA thioesterase FadM